jgi:triacylglycerol lipase
VACLIALKSNVRTATGIDTVVSFPSDCPSLNAPVVLAHGLFGFRRIGLGPVTLARYFRQIPEYLQAAGNRVLVSQVPPISSIEHRSRVLARQIRSAFGGQPVHIIGHSSGGLDARALLGREQDAKLVMSLTTIATPHLGSALADHAKLGFGAVYRLLAALKVDHGGFLDITRQAAAEFHLTHPAPPDVACFSVAGDPTPESVCIPLRRCYEALHKEEGPNDGLVSVSSASAFGEVLPAWSADHLRQMNWLPPRKDVSALPLYQQIMNNLADHGFGQSYTPTLMS